MFNVVPRFFYKFNVQNLQLNYMLASIYRGYSYRSDLSLQNVYKGCNTKIETPQMRSGEIQKFNGYIPINNLSITYSRSSGPGGQHVNCVNTKVDVRFRLETADWIPHETRKLLMDQYKNSITKDGYFVVKSDLTRSQQMNLANALEKIRSIVFQLECPKKAEPKEESLERIQRRIEKAARDRLKLKRHRSQIKADRQVLHTEA